METACLLDGNALAYRAFFAIPPLTDGSGRPTNAVYGFLGMVEKTVRDLRPDYLACAFDSPGETFRHRLLPSYKANRPGMPEALAAQLPLLRELLAAWRVPALAWPGLEADDLLALMAVRARARGLAVRLVTSDKDLYQLVSAEVRVLQPQTREELGPEDVVRRFGVPPARLPDLFALAGDQGDNIPGVPGVGAKTARALVARFPDLESLFRALDGLEPPALRRRLAAGRETAFLSRRLAVLPAGPPPPGFAPPDWPEMRRRAPDEDALRDLYRRLAFHRRLAALEPGGGKPPAPPRQPTLFEDG